MPGTDGIIRNREKVELTKPQIAVVEKLYGEQLIAETIVEEMTYLSDGLNINGYIARPKDKGQYPTLIWNRGGFGDRGALDNLTAYLILASTAAWGYTVLETQYRGNMGSEGDDEAWGGEDLTDALNLIKAADNIPECDTNRMAIEGASRGGMVTYRALKEKDIFKCAIVHAGVSNLISLRDNHRNINKSIQKRFRNLNESELRKKLEELSAVCFADKLPGSTPILMMHGTADNVIPISQSEELAEKLEKYGVPHKYVRIEGGTHVALKDGSYKEIDRHRKAWLDEFLK